MRNKGQDTSSAPGVSPGDAFSFVLTLGIVNLFADATYEGGASINGPFMATLGASAATISIVAGVGEFLGYSLRSVAGYVSDKTGKYWLITFIGYGINLFAVPAMALAGNWQVAATLVLAERMGRAIRKPTIEAMLSYTTAKMGRGWVYGLNTALDETGAMLGPLLMALVLFVKGSDSYRTGYALLLVSTFLAIGALALARFYFPAPAQLEAGPTARARGFTGAYWLYMSAASCFGAGLMSFELVSFHLSSAGTATGQWIPVFVALATAMSIATSLTLGRLYDRLGLPVLLVAIGFSALFSPFVFLGGFALALVGMLLWGIGYAVQDALLKAVVAGLLPEAKRNLAFGLFYTGYGVGWLVGSIATGMLYDRSIPWLVAFAISAQLISIPLFLLAHRVQRLGPSA